MNARTKLALLAASVLPDVAPPEKLAAPADFDPQWQEARDAILASGASFNGVDRGVLGDSPPAPVPPAPIIYNAGGRVSSDTPGKKVRDKGARRLIRARAKREARDARALERELARKENK